MTDEEPVPCAFCYSEPSIYEDEYGFVEIGCCNEYMVDEDGPSVQHEIVLRGKFRYVVISEWNSVMK